MIRASNVLETLPHNGRFQSPLVQDGQQERCRKAGQDAERRDEGGGAARLEDGRLRNGALT